MYMGMYIYEDVLHREREKGGGKREIGRERGVEKGGEREGGRGER